MAAEMGTGAKKATGGVKGEAVGGGRRRNRL
jgi:hypothetical protein